MCETCESCVQRWHNWMSLSGATKVNAANLNLCVSVLFKLCDVDDFVRVQQRLQQQLVPHAEKIRRKWKELHPSVQVWVREMAGKLMWRRESEWEREETQNELFHLRVRVEKERLDSTDDVYSWAVRDGGCGGVKGPLSESECFCRQCADCVSARWPLQTIRNLVFVIL